MGQPELQKTWVPRIIGHFGPKLGGFSGLGFETGLCSN